MPMGNVEKLEALIQGYLKGKIGRRDFVVGGLQLGLSLVTMFVYIFIVLIAFKKCS